MKLKITLLIIVNIIFLDQFYAQCDGADFEEKNGIAILEMESKLAGSWKKESITGASANSALAYRGNNSFSNPDNSTINYSVRINSPGTYRFIWRNKIGVIASTKPTTEHNDSWLKINASDFYGLKGSHKVYPGGSGKSPVANGTTSGGYFKIYTGTIDWSWTALTSDNDGHLIYATFNQPGVYSILVGGRSNGHIIDRMVLYKESSYTTAQAQSLSASQSNCSGGSTPPTDPTPPTNTPPTVNFTNITNGQNFPVGSNLSIGLSASDSNGSIVKHEIFVNNSLVDTDGSSYTPHQLTNLSAGSYSVKATVTDNSGASSSATVNFTVGGDSPTPPDPTPPTGENKPPSVSFTTITNGQNFSVGSNVSVGLSTSDSDGSITKHEIFVNNSLVDTDGSNYTAHQITQLSAGNFTVKATVADNAGASTSATVNFTVGGSSPTNPPSGNTPPTVSFTSITNGQNFAVGSNLSIGLSASDANGSITKHQIFVNNTLVDTDGSSYTPHKLSNLREGNYSVKATVTDNNGASTSATVNFTVGGSSPTNPPTGNTSPTVRFTNLINGQQVTPGSTVSVGVAASDSDGSITKHQIFVNGKLVDTDGASYTPHPIESISAGNYEIKVIVTDNLGATGSSTVNIIATSSVASKTLAYPNPVSSDGKVSLKLPEGTSGPVTYSVTNALGIQLDQGKFIANPSERDVDLQLSNVGRQMKGVYYLTVISSDSKQTIPIIRE